MVQARALEFNLATGSGSYRYALYSGNASASASTIVLFYFKNYRTGSGMIRCCVACQSRLLASAVRHTRIIRLPATSGTFSTIHASLVILVLRTAGCASSHESMRPAAAAEQRASNAARGTCATSPGPNSRR